MITTDHSPKKLAFCLYRYFPYGGMERNFLTIANACLAQGHEINVYVHEWQGEIPEGFNIHTVPSRGLTNHRRLKSFNRQLQKQLTQAKHDCVVGFNRLPKLDFYYCADVCFRYQSDIKHHWLFRLTNRFRTYAKFEAKVFSKKSTTEILLLSERQKDHYQHYYDTPNERFHLLPPGIKRDYQRPADALEIRDTVRSQHQIDPNSLVLLFIGSDFKRKGLDRILKSLKALKERPLKLWVIGAGRAKPILNFIKRHGLTDRVELLGAIDNVRDYLLAADFLVHPAYFENTGNVILEALIAGLPVITTENCGYASHITAARAGIVLADPFKQTQLTAALRDPRLKHSAENFRNNALNYAKHTDLYSRAEQATKIITEFVR